MNKGVQCKRLVLRSHLFIRCSILVGFSSSKTVFYFKIVWCNTELVMFFILTASKLIMIRYLLEFHPPLLLTIFISPQEIHFYMFQMVCVGKPRQLLPF